MIVQYRRRRQETVLQLAKVARIDYQEVQRVAGAPDWQWDSEGELKLHGADGTVLLTIPAFMT